MIHGRYDVSGPLDTAWQLSRQWSISELQVLDDAGPWLRRHVSSPPLSGP
jgi:hypothetical protein